MNISLAASKLPLGLAYFIAASAALTLTRYDGGVAFLWVAGALLIADLVRTRRSRWLYSVVPCVIASGLATGRLRLRSAGRTRARLASQARVNDRYGHGAGDEVLRTFAEVMRRIVREGDSIARLGGEEFAILFPATALPKALLICDRVRTEMAEAVTFIGNAAIRVTVSGGVALLDRRGPDLALKRADQALYFAKRAGRDQMALAA